MQGITRNGRAKGTEGESCVMAIAGPLGVGGKPKISRLRLPTMSVSTIRHHGFDDAEGTAVELKSVDDAWGLDQDPAEAGPKVWLDKTGVFMHHSGKRRTQIFRRVCGAAGRSSGQRWRIIYRKHRPKLPVSPRR